MRLGHCYEVRPHLPLRPGETGAIIRGENTSNEMQHLAPMFGHRLDFARPNQQRNGGIARGIDRALMHEAAKKIAENFRARRMRPRVDQTRNVFGRSVGMAEFGPIICHPVTKDASEADSKTPRSLSEA